MIHNVRSSVHSDDAAHIHEKNSFLKVCVDYTTGKASVSRLPLAGITVPAASSAHQCAPRQSVQREFRLSAQFLPEQAVLIAAAVKPSASPVKEPALGTAFRIKRLHFAAVRCHIGDKSQVMFLAHGML